MVVKLGVSLIPLRGAIITGIVDASAELFLSFDAKSLVEVFTETFSIGVQGAADVIPEIGTETWTRKQIERHTNAFYNARLAQIMTSAQVLNSSCSEAGSIRQAIAAVYEGDARELSNQIRAVLAEHRIHPQDGIPVPQVPGTNVVDATSE